MSATSSMHLGMLGRTSPVANGPPPPCGEGLGVGGPSRGITCHSTPASPLLPVQQVSRASRLACIPDLVVPEAQHFEPRQSDPRPLLRRCSRSGMLCWTPSTSMITLCESTRSPQCNSRSAPASKMVALPAQLAQLPPKSASATSGACGDGVPWHWPLPQPSPHPRPLPIKGRGAVRLATPSARLSRPLLSIGATAHLTPRCRGRLRALWRWSGPPRVGLRRSFGRS